jgi:8-oxo-dGTP pyrophosphatase MutT (NUDIX family)
MPVAHFLRDYLSNWCGASSPWNVDAEEQAHTAKRIAHLIENEPRAAMRDCFPAHLTGSAFVLNEACDAAALIFHRKIQKWMQPGGHADGDFLLERVAWREAFEETGLEGLRFVRLPGGAKDSPLLPFDVDIHLIPEHGSVPEHYHFDVRYLLVAKASSRFFQTDEVGGIEWIPLSRVAALTGERSVLRMVEKVQYLSAAQQFASVYRDSVLYGW